MGVVTWVRYDLREVKSDESMRRALAGETPAAWRFEQLDDNTVVAFGRVSGQKVAWYQRFVDGIPQPERHALPVCPRDGNRLRMSPGTDWR